MAGSVPKPSSLTSLNSIQPEMVKVGIPVNVVDGAGGYDVDDAAVLILIVTSYRRAGLKLAYLAALSRVKESQMSGALNGHGGFNVRWLWAWPPEFWNEFIPALRAAKEQTEDARRAYRKELLMRAIELLLAEVA